MVLVVCVCGVMVCMEKLLKGNEISRMLSAAVFSSSALLFMNNTGSWGKIGAHARSEATFFWPPLDWLGFTSRKRARASHSTDTSATHTHTSLKALKHANLYRGFRQYFKYETSQEFVCRKRNVSNSINSFKAFCHHHDNWRVP